jgi:hypothetical protein
MFGVEVLTRAFGKNWSFVFLQQALQRIWVSDRLKQ